MFFLMVVPGMHLLASFLVIVGVTCLGSSFVILNSFLPLLVANHPLAQEYGGPPGQDPAYIPMESMPPAHMDSALEDHNDGQPSDYSNAKTTSKTGSLELQLSTKISSAGVGIGYLAAVFVQ